MQEKPDWLKEYKSRWGDPYDVNLKDEHINTICREIVCLDRKSKALLELLEEQDDNCSTWLRPLNL